MGFFSAFKTLKAYTGVVTEKKTRKFTDSEGDEVSRFSVVILTDGDQARELTLDIDHKLYDKVAVGNKVVKEEKGKVVIKVDS